MGGLKTFLAGCLLRLDELDAAFSFCQDSIYLCEESGNKWLLALALRTLGEIISCQKPLDAEKVEQAIQESIRLQQEIEAKPELARSYVSYAKLLNIKVESEKAKEGKERTRARKKRKDSFSPLPFPDLDKKKRNKKLSGFSNRCAYKVVHPDS